MGGTSLGVGPHWTVLGGVVLAPWLTVVCKDTFPLSAEDPVVLLRHCGICHSLTPSLEIQPSITLKLSFTAAWRS